MKQLEIKLNGRLPQHLGVFIDNESVALKRDNYSGTATYSTEKEKVEVCIYSYLELNGPLWFLVSMFFFVISLFGIFAPRYDKKCVVCSVKFFLTLGEQETVNVKFIPPTVNGKEIGGRAVEVSSDFPFEVTENSYSVDMQAKKRRKILFVIKLILWLAVIGTLIGFAFAFVTGVIHF